MKIFCLCGLWLSTFPSYPVFLLIYCLLAVFADMLYWPTMLKTVRLLGNEDEQGRMFGILEAGRGLMDTIVAFCALGIFSAFGSNEMGLRAAILFYAIVPGVIAIIAYFLLDPDEALEKNSAPAASEKPQKKSNDTISRALKNKNIWLVSLNVFFVYSVYCGLTYFIPFLEEAYALPAVMVGVYGVINQYELKMLGGPIGSFVGYLPGAFMYAVYGAILDNFEGMSGYRIVFIVMAVFAVIGFFLCAYILKTIKKQKG